MYVMAGELVNTIHLSTSCTRSNKAALSSSSGCHIVKSHGCESIYSLNVSYYENVLFYFAL